jgi:hypothetical protein
VNSRILPIIKIVVVLGASVCAWYFAMHANEADLGFHSEAALSTLTVNAQHDTSLIARHNVEITEGYYYVPAAFPPGYLLYRIKALSSVRYGRLFINGWNNKLFRISWSSDGSRFQNIDWTPPLTGFNDNVTLKNVPPETHELYLRIDMAGDRSAGQTNLYSLRAFFTLDPPLTPIRIVISLLIAAAVLFEWLFYSLVASRLSEIGFKAAALDDAVAHWPLFALLLARPIAHIVTANVTGATLIYALLAFFFVRLYQLIRRSEPSGHERLVTIVLMAVLMTSSVLYMRMITGDGDGAAYYAFSRSLVIDRDLNFRNEFEYANTAVGIGMPIELIPSTGMVRYPYPIGTGLGQLPFVAAAHVATHIARLQGIALAADGYSALYPAFVAAGSVLCSFLALCLTVKILIPLVGRMLALLASLTVWFGTSTLSMVYLHPSHSHAVDLAMVMVFFFFWLRGRDRKDVWQWLLIGLLLGLCVIVREQNLVLGAVPAFELMVFWIDGWRQRTSIFRLGRITFSSVAAAAIGFGFAYLPQIIFNLIQAHSPWYSVFSKVPIAWFSPKIGAVLYGSEHGLLYWTPLTLLGFLGLALLVLQDWRRWGGVALVVVLTIYQIGAFGLFGGAGAGMRYFINMSLPMTIGSAVTIRAIASRIGLRSIALICGLGVLINLWLVSAYAMGAIPEMGRGVTFRPFLRAVTIEGPELTTDFLDGVTYFRKRAPAIGATLYHRLMAGEGEPSWVLAAIMSLCLLGIGGWVIQSVALGFGEARPKRFDDEVAALRRREAER